MKPNLTTLPNMYADWMAVGLSMLLGKLPTGPTTEPKLNGIQAAAERGRADNGVSVKPAKKARWKPAARKSLAKPAAKHARRAAPAKKRRASGKRR